MAAITGQEPVSLMRTAEYLQARPVGWLLAGLVGVAISLAAPPPSDSKDAARTHQRTNWVARVPADQTSGTNGLGLLALPRPVPAHRADLPAAFTKVVPTSIADLKAIERHIKALAARLSPAVVAIEIGSGSGSGVVVSADGLVLTAGHVCGRRGRTARFTFPDGKTTRGKTVGVDFESDTGFMQITDRGTWPHVAMGDLKQARVGDWVLALGHPGGFDRQRSLVVRSGRIIEVTDDALQTDCAIGPGDSGGPLFDMHGRVIGIHDAISSSVSDNFHVPATEFYDTWEVLTKGADWR